MEIYGKFVKLRAINEEDLPMLNTWGNEPELWRLLGGWHFPVSKNSTQTWFEKIQTDTINQRLAITTEKDGLIGLANLLDIDWKNRHAFHGMMLGNPNVRGKGLGQDTIMAIMRYSFMELGLERLDGSMIEFNSASLKTYCEKCGWKQEGRQRNWYYREGRYWDRIIVGIIKQDYLNLIETNNYWNKT